MGDLEEKHSRLKVLLGRMDSLIVAFSGGVDSALLLKVAHDVLGNRVLAVTADSPSLPRRELEEARRIARRIGVRHLVIKTDETRNGDYVRNPRNRCYFCKAELYSKLYEIARRKGIRFVADGTNMDDLGDYRPGLKAAEEYRVVSPLRDAGFTKNDIRTLARGLGLEVWDKPASPCLSSRIPYGSEITLRKLAMIEESENLLKELGLRELRVRHFEGRARIEVNTGDLGIIGENLGLIVEGFKKIGFNEIEITQFRSGSLNSLNVQGKD
ncbi:MAG TPA: ATP-dependent sacrificial sulfur transferase LarE [Thermodesulfobacteriota bacterium]|jgi:uncharacterized protein|nr:ATP-dependent sacrificial sulfur transferase LarE [Thermodesulfobacteriota bacterium]